MTRELRIPLPNQGSLAGRVVTSPTASNFAVVWVHGFGSHRGGEKSAALQAECERRNVAFAAVDFRGHGDSSGTMHALTASGLLQDVDAIRAALAGRGFTRLGLVGSSMGGFAAAWFAARHPEVVAGCVLLAPAFQFLERRWNRLTPAERDDWQRTDRLRFRNEWVEADLGYALVAERDQFRAADLAKRYRTPTLIFHGLADDVVPYADSLEFLQQVEEPRVELRVFKDGDHRLTAYKDEIASEVCRFFERRRCV